MKRDTRHVLVLVAATALTRWAFRSQFLYDIDSVNFALALRRFDPAVHQPHPPGYFLYVVFGKLLNLLVHDPNTALVAISIAASCGTVAWIHLLASEWFGGAAARCAGLLFLVSPLAWFHGTVALTYMVEAFFSVLAGYFSWRVYRGAMKCVFPAAAALALAAGFRQSSLVTLAPLVLFSFRRAPPRLQLFGLGAFLLILAAWCIPMLQAAGGMNAYAASLWSLWRLVPARQTVFTSSLFTSLVRAGMIGWIYVLCFGSAALLPLRLFPMRTDRTGVAREIKIFTWTWLLPGLLLFTFVYLKFVNSGYVLVLLPPVCIWLGNWAADWHHRSPWGKSAKAALLGSAAAVNCSIFLFAPFYFSWLQVRRSQQELAAAVASVREAANPQDTVIVGFDSHFLGYRQAGYYLPEYFVVQFPEVPYHSGTGVFTMLNQNTRVLSHLSLDPFRKFLIFPLPSNEREYLDYLEGVRARFPSGVLRATTHHGVELVRGPASALGVLFPNTTFSKHGPSPRE